jgi:hypothetical protein
MWTTGVGSGPARRGGVNPAPSQRATVWLGVSVECVRREGPVAAGSSGIRKRFTTEQAARIALATLEQAEAGRPNAGRVESLRSLPGWRRSQGPFISGGCFVLLENIGRDASAVVDMDSVFFGPGPDVRAVVSGWRGTRRPLASPACLAGATDERRNLRPEPAGVLDVEVDLILVQDLSALPPERPGPGRRHTGAVAGGLPSPTARSDGCS